MEERRKYRAGDVVMVPNGEKWHLACDETSSRDVYPLGWTHGSARADQCSLVEEVPERESEAVLRRSACVTTRSHDGNPYDPRWTTAREQWLAKHSRRPLVPGPSPIVGFPSPPFENRAGVIQNLVEGSFSGCALIRSPPGAVRSNHWHRTDSHHLHVVEGRLLYWEAACPEADLANGRPPPGVPWLVERGETFLTGPGVAHAIAFLLPTLMVSVSTLPRDNASHEADLVRVPFVGEEELERVAPWLDWRP